MNGPKNTYLLDKIIEYTKKIVEDNEALTTEKFLFSVVKLCSFDNIKELAKEFETKGISVSEKELECSKPELSDSLQIIDSNIGDKKLLEKVLRDTIAEQKTSIFHIIDFDKKLYRVQADAFKSGKDFVCTDKMVEVIINEPTDLMRQCIEQVLSKKETDTQDVDFAKKRADDLEDELISFVEKVFKEEREKEEAEKAKETDNTDNNKLFTLTDEVKRFQAELLKEVFGQDNAVSCLAAGYFQAVLSSSIDKNNFRPKVTFLFAGPPGVGKTFLAEKSAELLNIPFRRFDMSEYADKEANIEFAGSDNVYRDAKEGNVTKFVSDNPRSLLLFDEIEKAHPVVIHLFLQILDAGKLRDNKTDKEVSFKDTIIIFTTNAGRPLYGNDLCGDYSSVSKKVILNAIRKDVNPQTKAPYFPEALCSRFAYGNVVMFNGMTAHNLLKILRKEIERTAKNFESNFNTKISISDDVYSSILFAEGGNVDARTIKGKASTFLSQELFELYRLLGSTNADNQPLKKINIKVSLPRNKEIRSLFRMSERSKVMLYSKSRKMINCIKKSKAFDVLIANDIEEANEILFNNDVEFLLVDYYGDKKKNNKILNVEDMGLSAREFFNTIRETNDSLPVYFINRTDNPYTDEEKVSFNKRGVREYIDINLNKFDLVSFEKLILIICEKFHQQSSINQLAKANKLLQFETLQSISKDGKTAEIKLFDYKLVTAVDAEDSKNIISNVSKPNVHFDDIIGAEDAKDELKYYVNFLTNPKKYLRSGVKSPKGLLFYGPPGTGKTMLAKAMACESDVTFISFEGNGFLKKYVGEGPEKVHELFNIARKYAPSILFIDEIDAIAKERKGDSNASVQEAVLTAFLAEMDGFNNDNTKPVIVLAATNYNVSPGNNKSLDPALMRRFDRRIYVDLPTKIERKKYLAKRLNGRIFNVSYNKIENLALRSVRMSLAQLDSIVEFAIRTAIRNNKNKVTDEIIDEVFETFKSGEKKTWSLKELEMAARHEAGHALICWLSGDTPSYVTIVSRGNYGGYMQHSNVERKATHTKNELRALIRISLAGRAAEMVYYGEEDGITTGASSDLNYATSLATSMICSYGMSKKNGMATISLDEVNNNGLPEEIRNEVNQILDEELNNAVELINKNRGRLDALVDELITKNHLTEREITAIFSKKK